MNLTIIENKIKRFNKHFCVDCRMNIEGPKYWLVKNNVKNLGIFHFNCANKYKDELFLDLKIKLWHKRMEEQHITDDILFEYIEFLDNKLKICEEDKLNLIKENNFLKNKLENKL